MGQVDQEHIREWLDQGRARISPPGATGAFRASLNELPWTGTHPAWGEIDHRVIRVDDINVAALAETPLGNHENVLVMFSPEEPGIICGTLDALERLDVLFWKAPGPRYLCGVDLVDGDVIASYDDFAEYDGADTLRISLQGAHDD
jgi:hypothetical protein